MRKFHVHPECADEAEALSQPMGITGGQYYTISGTSSGSSDLTDITAYGYSHEPPTEAGLRDTDGREHGWWNNKSGGSITKQTLFKHGVIKQERNYDYGVLYSVINKNSRGSERITVGQSGRPLVAYTLIANTHRTLSMFQGAYKEWDSEGNLFLEVRFKKCVLHGMSKLYHANGKVKESCRYVKGVRYGFHRTFYPSGAKKVSIEYKKGKRIGWAHNWDATGKCIAFHHQTKMGHSYVSGSQNARTYLRNSPSHLVLPMFATHVKLMKESLRGTKYTSSFCERLEWGKKNKVKIQEVSHCVSS